MKKRKKAYIDNGFISKNGVCFGNDISLQYTKKHESSYFGIARAIFALITSFATMSMFASFILQRPNYAPIFLCCVIPVMLICVIRSKNSGIKTIGIIFLAAYFLYFLFQINDITDGFFCNVYLYLERAKQPSGILGNSLSGIPRSMYNELAGFFLQFLSSVVSVLVTIACVVRIDFPMLFLTTFPLFELGIYWGWQPPLLSVVILIISWIVVISLHTINQRTNKIGKKNTFAVHEKKQTYYLTNDKEKSKMFFILLSFTVILCAAMMILIISFSNIFGHERSDKVNDLRSKINNFVNNFSLEDLGGLFADYDGGLDFFGTKAVGGTNGGKLGEIDGISFNGTTALVVTTKPLNETMYIRGYVAGNYHDNSWDPVDYDDSKDFAKELDEMGISPQDINYFQLTDLTNFFETNNIAQNYTTAEEIDIKVKGASKKYVYAPYGTLYSNGKKKSEYKMRPYLDSYVKLGTNNYTVVFRKPGNDSFGEIRNRIADKSVFYDVNSTVNKETVKGYEKFVKENYSKVSNSDGLQAAYKEINEKYLVDSDRSYSSVIYAIKRYFQDNYKYTLEPGKTPSGRDFVDYFLSNQKQGYCSYFASAGVQLLRKFGFQARYVEGYIVLPGMTKTTNETADVDIPDKCAHAWTEVYIEDFGWSGVEFTPGYTNDNPNMTEKEKNPYDQKPPEDSSSINDSSSSSSEESSQAESSDPDSTLSIADQSSSEASSNDTSSESISSSQSSGDSNSEGGTESDVESGGANGSGGDNSGQIGEVSDSNSSDNNSKTESSSTARMIIFIVAFVIIFIAVIVLRRILSLKTMQSNCLEGASKTRLKHIVRYTVKYLDLIGISGSYNITDMQLCKQLDSQLRSIDIDLTDKLYTLFETAEEAYMGNHVIDESDIKEAYSTLKYISDEVVKPKLNPIKLFRAKFVNCLY